jgi:hypothetical protein
MFFNSETKEQRQDKFIEAIIEKLNLPDANITQIIEDAYQHTQPSERSRLFRKLSMALHPDKFPAQSDEPQKILQSINNMDAYVTAKGEALGTRYSKNLTIYFQNYELALYSELNDETEAELGKIYLAHQGEFNYVVLNHDGVIQKGALSNNVDLSELENKLNDEAFKSRILEETASARQALDNYSLSEFINDLAKLVILQLGPSALIFVKHHEYPETIDYIVSWIAFTITLTLGLAFITTAFILPLSLIIPKLILNKMGDALLNTIDSTFSERSLNIQELNFERTVASAEHEEYANLTDEELRTRFDQRHETLDDEGNAQINSAVFMTPISLTQTLTLYSDTFKHLFTLPDNYHERTTQEQAKHFLNQAVKVIAFSLLCAPIKFIDILVDQVRSANYSLWLYATIYLKYASAYVLSSPLYVKDAFFSTPESTEEEPANSPVEQEEIEEIGSRSPSPAFGRSDYGDID